MKFREVFRFEVGYRLRQPATWIYAGILLGIPILMMHAVEGATSHINSPESVANSATMISMLGMLVTAALFGDAAIRDDQWRMRPLFYTAPLGEGDYLVGRFAGALAVNAVLLMAIPLGLAAATRLPYLEAGMFGPFQAAAYVQAYLLFLLPNLVLSGAILFTVAVLTRQMLPTYLGGIGLFVGYLFATEFYDRVASRTVAALIDPFAITALEDLTRYWTPAELNTRLIGFPEVLVWNRLIWVAVGVAVLALLLLRFRFADPGAGRRRRTGEPRAMSAARERQEPVVVPAVRRAFGFRTRAWQTLAVARRSLAEIVSNRAFLVIAGGALVFVFAFGWDVGGVVFGTSTWPVTHLIAGTVLSGTISMVIAVLIALLAGELVWRERDVGVGDVTDVAPVPNWVSLLGRFLALVVMVVGLQAVLMAAGVMLQAVQGYHRFELGLYLQILFGLELVDYVLLAALFMAVHVVVHQKYLGHLVVVLYYVFTLLPSQFGVHDNLLVYGSDPGWIYSDMNGFGPFLVPWAWFKLYWAAWALWCAILASLFWVRGREVGVRRRMELARGRFAGPVVRAAGVAAILIVTLGGFIFYNTNVLNGDRTPLEIAASKAEYERRYKRFEDAPQPRIVGADLRVEIHPGGPATELRGSYRLVNDTDRAIDSIHVIVPPEIQARSIGLSRGAERVLEDRELQYHIYALERPLQLGDSMRLDFDVAFRPRGFPNSGVPTAVVRNGSYFDRAWLPIIGYQPALELAGEKARREHGLAPRPPAPSAHDVQARRYRSDLRDADLVDIDAVIGTDEDQIAITGGALHREWAQDGRRYFHYRSKGPLWFEWTPFLSAEYEVLEDRWKDVALRIFHHPTHSFNLGRMVRGMQASLDYYSEHFGPYPFEVLRIVEFPRYAGFARGHPHTIAFSEGNAFLTRVEEGELDRPFFVTAHETAHQWWGNQVRGANVRGKAFLSETLAQYGAMMVMEKALGSDQVRRFYDYEMDHYLTGRRNFANVEAPLLEVTNQTYVFYNKGAVAMYALRHYLGEERVNLALRRFLEKHRSAGPPYPTARDLYGELQAVTPDSLQYLLVDLFEEITLWDVRAEEARVEPAGTGEYRVTIDVAASKARADSVGNETEVPMDDLVEIGVFAAAAEGEPRGEPLYLRRHRIRSGQQVITVTVPRQPAWAGVDPYGWLIERDGGDNVVEIGDGG